MNLFDEAEVSGMRRTARFSDCRTYRYELWRIWENGKPFVQFIGLNPSTADETNDDPTLRRCIQFAKDWGYGGMVMTNAFAYRSTDPKALGLVGDPKGPDNDATLLQMASRAGIVVCAWGGDKAIKHREAEVVKLLEYCPLYCIRETGKGHPEHPLYLPKILRPKPWPREQAEQAVTQP